MNDVPEEFRNSPTIVAQRTICERYGAEFYHTDPYQVIGVANNVQDKTLFPINGVRHPIEGQSTGWYVWRGDVLSTEDDFFKPHHVMHIHQICPEILAYLGLAPGWRFLIAPGYEDVWYDETLLQIKPIDSNESRPHP
jgi:hypothetical protein